MDILIVEDEPKVASFLKKGLELQGFNTEVAYDGNIALRMATSLDAHYDAIIMDVNLPVINGFDVCEKLRGTFIDFPTARLIIVDPQLHFRAPPFQSNC